MANKFTLEENKEIIATVESSMLILEEKKQVMGTFTFTNKRINFTYSMQGKNLINNIVKLFIEFNDPRIKFIELILDIYYDAIKYIEPAKIGFHDIGINIFEKEEDSCRYCISVSKRDKYIDIINERIANNWRNTV